MTKPNSRLILFNIFVFIATLLSFQLGMGYLVIQQTTLKSLRKDLNKLSERVKSDIVITGDSWNTEKYLSDPYTPYPNGSSGYLHPLYIISDKGFVVERNMPINGLLDSSDFKHLSLFETPQFVSGETNEKWRVLSKRIMKDNITVGIIFVSSYNPSINDIDGVDKILSESIDKIIGKIKFKGNQIDVSNIDTRDISYNISYEVVTVFNKVLINNGRTPSFIDTSYIHSELQNDERTIKDKITNEAHLIKTSVLINDRNEVKGVLVAALSLSELNSILNNYLYFTLIIDLLLIIPLTITSYLFLKPRVRNILKHYSDVNDHESIPKTLIFDHTESYIQIDDKKISIPYASNQYYLCKSLFAYPQKRWERDELLEKMGEDTSEGNSRKIYDAVLAINKKTNLKLITYKNKTYRLNSHFISSIKKSL